MKTESYPVPEEIEKNLDDLQQPTSQNFNSPSNKKMIIYSKQRQTINDNPVYTISKKTEHPPIINNLFHLKVRVPKVKVSKYFQSKYSSIDSQRSYSKLNNLQFMPNASIQEENRNLQDYDYKYVLAIKNLENHHALSLN